MRFFKKLFLWLGISFLLIFLASIVIALLFEDEIGQTLVTQINKELVNELEVENFRLSLIKGFPNVSADLQNIVLPDNKEGILLEAESMSFQIGLFGLLTSSINVKSVLIENGALFVEIDRRGKANYFITKPKEKNTARAEMNFSLSLDEAILENIELIYVDKRSKQEMKLLLDKANFTGEFDNEQFSLASKAASYANFIEIDGSRYFVGKKLAYEANIYVDLSNQFYEIQKAILTVGKNSFDINGTIESHASYTGFDLEVTTEDGNMESVIQLLPEEYQYLDGFRSRGDFSFDATIKGKLNAQQRPIVNLKFGLDDGRIDHEILESAIKDVSFSANLRTGKSHSGRDVVFKLHNFKGYFNRELIESELTLSNLQNPSINFRLDGTLPLKTIYPLFDSPLITNGRGEVEIRNVQLEGRYADMINPGRIHRVQSSGIVEFDDASLTINDERLLLDRGILTLKDNQLSIDDLKLEGAGSELVLNGEAQNFLPVLLADSINSKDAKLRFKASLQSEHLDLDRLIATTEIPSNDNLVAKGDSPLVDSTKIENIHRKEVITNFLEGTFTAEVETFNYDLIQGESFTGNLEFGNKRMNIIGEAGAMGGSFDLDGYVSFERLPKLKAKLVCNDIDAREFFRQGRNFGQAILQDRHIEGKLNAKMVISAAWDANGAFMNDELRVIAGIDIHDGELNDFELLDNFKSYVNSRDLRRVRFVDMKNWLEIQNGRIYIPVMFIQTNAMNMLLSGEHTFDNDIDYNIKVNAGQVLLTKLKKHNSNLRPQPAKKNGLFNLYFNVAGNVDDYDIKTNKRKVKKEFTFSEYRKEAIQKALASEFGKSEITRELKKIEADIPEFEDTEGEEYLDEIEGGVGN